jgi:hypothetical protein
MIVERLEDMSPRGFLRLIKQDDGDIIIGVGQCDHDGLIEKVASVEFCTVSAGGGASPRVRAALIQLMGAMAEDNLSSRHVHRRPEHFDPAEQQAIADWAKECGKPDEVYK